MGRLFSPPAQFAIWICLAGSAADACVVAVPRHDSDIQFADVVVLGTVTDYRIVPSLEARRRREAMLARSPDMPRDLRDSLERQTSFLGDYARIGVRVDRVLKGQAPATLAVTWFNATFQLPDRLPAGQYLLALRRSASRSPPMRVPSTTFVPDTEPNALTILQSPCSSPFLLPSHGPGATRVLETMGLDPLGPAHATQPPRRGLPPVAWALIALAAVAGGITAVARAVRLRRPSL